MVSLFRDFLACIVFRLFHKLITTKKWEVKAMSNQNNQNNQQNQQNQQNRQNQQNQNNR